MSRHVTHREMEVLTLLAEGNTAKRIGEILGISERTVYAHTQSVAEKLDAANSTQAVAIAIRNGLIKL